MKAVRLAAAAFETCVLLLVLGAHPLTWAQAAAPAGRSIYTCVSATGKTLTSDRLIADCSGREQRILNADGSLNRIVPPSLTGEERARVEEHERAASAARNAKIEAARRDRSLLTRYPSEAAHAKARAVALDSVHKLLRASEGRLIELAKERKPLTADAEFYAGKPLPPQLKARLDANDVSTEGQRLQIESQRAELDRINKNYDTEFQRLKKLWAGASPGAPEQQADASAPAR